MADTVNKKAFIHKRAKKKQDKLERREERKNNNDKGKSLEEMMVYVDAYGNITDVPVDQQKRREIKAEEIQLGATVTPETRVYTGIVTTFLKDKGFGFIAEDGKKESVFLHINKMLEPVQEKDKVEYEKEKTAKGFAAFNVRKIK